MYPLVQEFLVSGLSVKSFCQERGLGPYKFQYWVNKYRKNHNQANSEPEKGFIPVHVKGKSFRQAPGGD